MDSGGKQNIVAPATSMSFARYRQRNQGRLGKEHSFKMALTVDQEIFTRGRGAVPPCSLRTCLSTPSKYTPTGRSVSLDVRRDNDWLRVTVADEGIGVEVEDQAHVV